MADSSRLHLLSRSGGLHTLLPANSSTFLRRLHKQDGEKERFSQREFCRSPFITSPVTSCGSAAESNEDSCRGKRPICVQMTSSVLIGRRRKQHVPPQSRRRRRRQPRPPRVCAPAAPLSKVGLSSERSDEFFRGRFRLRQ